jgi:hypothetical protein
MVGDDVDSVTAEVGYTQTAPVRRVQGVAVSIDDRVFIALRDTRRSTQRTNMAAIRAPYLRHAGDSRRAR